MKFPFAHLLIIVCLNFYAPSFSQPVPVKYLRFDALTINDGLSQGMINCILQDSYGYMWFCTKDGLNRYDGYGFTVFRHDGTDRNSIADNFVRQIFEDSKRRLWVVTANRGLDLFDREAESFIHFMHDEKDQNTISDNRINVISEDRDGALWIGTVYGLNKMIIAEKPAASKQSAKHADATAGFFNNHDVTVVHIHLDPLQPGKELYVRKEGFPLTEIFSSNFFIDSKGMIWVSTYEKLFLIHPGKGENNKIENPDISNYYSCAAAEQGAEKFIQLFLEDTVRQRLYFISQCSVAQFERKSGNITLLSASSFHNGLISHPACTDAEGKIWLAESEWLEQFDVNKKEWQRILPEDNNLLPMLNTVSCTYRDKTGTIWTGTKGYGLLRHNPHSEKFNRTGSESIRWMSVTPDQKIIVTKYGKFLSVFDPATKSYTLSIADSVFSKESGFGASAVTYAALEDPGNIFWISRQCLVRYDANTKSIERFRPENHRCFPLYAGRENRLWMGTENAFSYIDKSTRQFHDYPYPVNPTHVPYDFLQAIHCDASGIFWLGTLNGLFRFDPEKESWKQFKNNPDDSTSLSFDLIFSLLPDPKEPEKYLWTGTNGGGLNRFDKTSGTFIHYSEKNGLPNNVVYGILNDNDGNLWMSTNKGISCFNSSTKQFKNYEAKDGLQSNEFNRNAFCKAGNGTLYFGGISGFNYFDPHDLKSNAVIPGIVITGIKLKNQPLSAGDENSPLQKPAYLTKKITLPYSESMITFEFASMDFTTSEKNIFMYKLDGFNNEWIHSENNHSATYTNLDPGSYTFTVKGTNSDGAWNENGTSIQVTILPPWYMTWWFRTAMIAAIAAAIYFFYRYRLQQALKIQAVRDRIASDLHDEIGSTLSSISLFSEVATDLVKDTHPEANTVINRISESTADMMESLGDIVWMINTRNDRFDDIINRMRGFAVEVLETKNCLVHFETAPELQSLQLGMSQRKNLYLIFKEAINNAAKYSCSTNMHIELFIKNKTVMMRIEDDGKGFDMSNGSGDGNGLINMRKRAQELKGEIKINSEKGKGTKIHLVFENKK